MELEYKFYIDESIDKEKILNSSFWEKFESEDWDRIEQNAHYYDTKEGMLADVGFALRIRNGELTIKAKSEIEGELTARPEWNLVWPSAEMDVDEVLKILNDELSFKQINLLKNAKSQGLRVQYKTEIIRHRKVIDYNNTLIEAAVDLGKLYGGTLSEDCYEMELEFISGVEEDFHRIALEAKDFFNLEPGHDSKMARAVKLKEKSELLDNYEH